MVPLDLLALPDLLVQLVLWVQLAQSVLLRRLIHLILLVLLVQLVLSHLLAQLVLSHQLVPLVPLVLPVLLVPLVPLMQVGILPDPLLIHHSRTKQEWLGIPLHCGTSLGWPQPLSQVPSSDP